MAENGLEGTLIGVILDGTGYGSDDTIWGGEFLVGGYESYRRAAHFRPVPLPGGDAAVREPWRMALAYLHQAIGTSAFSINHPIIKQLEDHQKNLFVQMLQRGISSPLTSSCGRLFDAVAALLNLRQTVSYDGQAAIELEALAETSEYQKKGLDQAASYAYTITSVAEPLQLDFSPIFPQILADLNAGISSSAIAMRFHGTIAAAIVEVCRQLRNSSGLERVVLSGGVFQNRLLSKMIYTSLSSHNFSVFNHRLVPPNDGGIALGQAAIAAQKGL
jgi:hydrogenase maturation protein HypF